MGNGMTATITAVRPDDGRARLTVDGIVDQLAVADLGSEVQALVATGARHVVLDVSQVRYCDRALLSELARLREQLRTRDGSLQVIGVQVPRFMAALRDASLDEVFVIFDAVRTADRFGVEPFDDPQSARTPPAAIATGAPAQPVGEEAQTDELLPRQQEWVLEALHGSGDDLPEFCNSCGEEMEDPLPAFCPACRLAATPAARDDEGLLNP